MEEYQKIKTTIKDWDEADRPREKLMSLGRQSLTNAELLAIILGGGNKEKNAVELAKEILLETEIEIIVSVGDGEFGATAWGCDLTYDYVKINGDYRT